MNFITVSTRENNAYWSVMRAPQTCPREERGNDGMKGKEERRGGMEEGEEGRREERREGERKGGMEEGKGGHEGR